MRFQPDGHRPAAIFPVDTLFLDGSHGQSRVPAPSSNETFFFLLDRCELVCDPAGEWLPPRRILDFQPDSFAVDLDILYSLGYDRASTCGETLNVDRGALMASMLR
jgi:hypothetical protein